MKGCARILAVICLVLFSLSAVLALVLVNVRFYLLSPETYTQALSEADLFEQLPALAAEQLRYSLTFNTCLEDTSRCYGEGPISSTGDNNGGPPSYFANMPEEVWEEVLSELIEPTWLVNQTRSLLEQVTAILTEKPTPDAIYIPLGEIKERIAGEPGYRVVENIIQAQPDCTPEQILELSQAFSSEGMNDVILNCRPPDEYFASIESYVRSGLSEVVGDLPARIEYKIPPAFRETGSGAATALSVAQASFRFAPWVAIFWLLAVTIFVVRDVRSWLGWWGLGFFMAGLGALFFGLSTDPLLRWNLDRFMLAQGPSGFSPTMVDLGFGIITRIVAGLSRRVLIQAGIMLAAGLLMLIFRFFTRPPSKGQIGTSLNEPRTYD